MGKKRVKPYSARTYVSVQSSSRVKKRGKTRRFPARQGRLLSLYIVTAVRRSFSLHYIRTYKREASPADSSTTSTTDTRACIHTSAWHLVFGGRPPSFFAFAFILYVSLSVCPSVRPSVRPSDRPSVVHLLLLLLLLPIATVLS